MPNLFEYFGLEPRFLTDEVGLRKEYLRLQKEWHPDLHISNPEASETALKKTALNNEAYNTLKTFESRVQYILSLYGLWKEGEKHTLPADFLSDMLDLNDLIADAKFGDEAAMAQATTQLNELENGVKAELQRLGRKADDEYETWNAAYLEPIRQEYEKYRYLHRLRRNLEGATEM